MSQRISLLKHLHAHLPILLILRLHRLHQVSRRMFDELLPEMKHGLFSPHKGFLIKAASKFPNGIILNYLTFKVKYLQGQSHNSSNCGSLFSILSRNTFLPCSISIFHFNQVFITMKPITTYIILIHDDYA